MELRDHLLRILEFNLQANLRIADSLRAGGEGLDDAVRLFAHMLNAEKIWFLRLEGFDTGAATPWDTLTLNECVDLARISAEAARGVLARLDAADFDQLVQYRNTRGDVFRSTVSDILMHLSHHGAYHRGQINRMLREHGATPATVDFIALARE